MNGLLRTYAGPRTQRLIVSFFSSDLIKFLLKKEIIFNSKSSNSYYLFKLILIIDLIIQVTNEQIDRLCFYF